MNKEEIIEIIKKEKNELTSKLRLLYAVFNKMDISTSDTIEEELGEQLEADKENLQILKDRQNVIGGAGHNRVCPCCGLRLPRGYFKKLLEDIKKQESIVKEKEMEYEQLAKNRETGRTNEITKKINEIEKKLEELKRVERESKNAGLI